MEANSNQPSDLGETANTAQDKYLKDDIIWVVITVAYMVLRWFLWANLNRPDVDLGAGLIFLEIILLVLFSSIILAFVKPHPLVQLLGSMFLIFIFPLFLSPVYGVQNYFPFDAVSFIFIIPLTVGIIRTIRKYKKQTA